MNDVCPRAANGSARCPGELSPASGGLSLGLAKVVCGSWEPSRGPLLPALPTLAGVLMPLANFNFSHRGDLALLLSHMIPGGSNSPFPMSLPSRTSQADTLWSGQSAFSLFLRSASFVGPFLPMLLIRGVLLLVRLFPLGPASPELCMTNAIEHASKMMGAGEDEMWLEQPEVLLLGQDQHH